MDPNAFDLDSPGLESVTLDEPVDVMDHPHSLSLADELEGISLESSSPAPSAPPASAASSTTVPASSSVPSAASSSSSSSSSAAPGNAPEEVIGRYDCKVGSPEKIGDSMNAYVRYAITSKNVEVQGPVIETTRRFSDFVWLHEKLTKSYPECAIPPIPEKEFNPMSKFADEFLDYRARELERFLKRVSAHPKLSVASCVGSFFNADVEEFRQLQQEEPKATVATQVFSFFSTKFNAAASASLPDVFGNAVEVDVWFESKREYVEALSTQLTELAAASNDLVARHAQMKQSYSAMATALSSLSKTEMDSDKIIADSFERVSTVNLELQLLEGELSYSARVHWAERLQDYQRVVESIKDMLNRRLESLAAYQAASKSLNSKKEALVKATGSKIPQLEAEVSKAEEKEADAKEVFDLRSASCKQELEAFERTKSNEMKLLIQRLAQMHMNHELRVLDLWKPILSDHA